MFYLSEPFRDEPMKLAQSMASASWVAARFFAESYWTAYAAMMEDLMAISTGQPLVEGMRDTRAVRVRAAERVFA